jgi:hypothetical protein
MTEPGISSQPIDLGGVRCSRASQTPKSEMQLEIEIQRIT